MNKNLKDCYPGICNRDFLMSGGGDIMTKEKIKEECSCIQKSVCIRVVELLDQHKVQEAEDLLINAGL